LTFSYDDMFHRLESINSSALFFCFSNVPFSTTTYHIENPYSIFVYAANTYRHPHSHHLSSLPSILRYIYVVPFFAMSAPSQPPLFFLLPLLSCLRMRNRWLDVIYLFPSLVFRRFEIIDKSMSHNLVPPNPTCENGWALLFPYNVLSEDMNHSILNYID